LLLVQVLLWLFWKYLAQFNNNCVPRKKKLIATGLTTDTDRIIFGSGFVNVGIWYILMIGSHVTTYYNTLVLVIIVISVPRIYGSLPSVNNVLLNCCCQRMYLLTSTYCPLHRIPLLYNFFFFMLNDAWHLILAAIDVF
jgi:hypothetical protein